jgi:hypothetical protein
MNLTISKCHYLLYRYTQKFCKKIGSYLISMFLMTKKVGKPFCYINNVLCLTFSHIFIQDKRHNYSTTKCNDAIAVFLSFVEKYGGQKVNVL